MNTMVDRKNEINQILKDLYESNSSIASEVIYNYLKIWNFYHDEQNQSIHDKYFEQWKYRFSYIDNIRVFCNNSDYFCHFENGGFFYDDINYAFVKMYIPLDINHIYEGVNRIFDFLAKNNIKHVSKCSSYIRTDCVVVRLFNTSDAKKLQSFIDNDSYFNNSMNQVNPFCINNNGIGYAYDGELSYNEIVSYIIGNYLHDSKKKNKDIKQINSDDFLKYVSNFSKDLYSCFNLGDHFGDSSLKYIPNILTYLRLSLITNDFNEYINFFDNIVKNNKAYENIIDTENYSDNLELLNKVIIAMMKKYPKGYDDKNPNLSGIDYLLSYFKGNKNSITRDNNYRKIVQENLSIEEAKEIVINSGVPNDDFDKMIVNYIEMILLNEIIRCSNVKFPDSGINQVFAYIEKGKSTYITNSIDNARCLTKSLSPNDIKRLFKELNVSDINEYVMYYYNGDKKSVKYN